MEADKVLGKRVEYPKAYCPEILVAVPRAANRERYGIGGGDGKTGVEGLFCGWDCWHAYEVSFLLEGGMPVVGLLKIVYGAGSRYIVESKSLKLYLASYNMERMGSTREEAVKRFTERVKEDLGRALETEVQAVFFEDGMLGGAEAGSGKGKEAMQGEGLPFDFGGYVVLENLAGMEKVQFTAYRECPEVLSAGSRECEWRCRENEAGEWSRATRQVTKREECREIKAGSRLLKSNCKITGQPDWGSIYVRMRGKRLPSEEGLLKYIVSLRNENHFHEEICEMTYKRLHDLFQPEVLVVSCLYTRRGGIDICPTRANAPEHLPAFLPQAEVLTARNRRS